MDQFRHCTFNLIARSAGIDCAEYSSMCWRMFGHDAGASDHSYTLHEPVLELILDFVRLSRCLLTNIEAPEQDVLCLTNDEDMLPNDDETCNW